MELDPFVAKLVVGVGGAVVGVLGTLGAAVVSYFAKAQSVNQQRQANLRDDLIDDREHYKKRCQRLEAELEDAERRLDDLEEDLERLDELEDVNDRQNRRIERLETFLEDHPKIEVDPEEI